MNNQESKMDKVFGAIGNTLYNSIFFFEKSSAVAVKSVDVVDGFMDTALKASEIANKNMQGVLDDLSVPVPEANSNRTES